MKEEYDDRAPNYRKKALQVPSGIPVHNRLPPGASRGSSAVGAGKAKLQKPVKGGIKTPLESHAHHGGV